MINFIPSSGEVQLWLATRWIPIKIETTDSTISHIRTGETGTDD
ncbi:hypothetical protein [Stenotrophomonas sp. 24(2023)]|nr:hypothetical protein [Stenotrophomonas sp. 24(2023)]WMJ69537.1 hypothetical protein Q9R17_00035 [Stenotrophomonas sp. 24(2023)]